MKFIKPEIDADGRIYEILVKAFENAETDIGGNALFNAYAPINKALKYTDLPDDGDIKISYNGDTISFSMEAKTGFIKDNTRTEVYYNSNEEYSTKTIQDISRLEKISSYFGISGGLTQVITHLAALKNSNQIEEVTLCDVNWRQLVYNSLQLARLDRKKKSVNPMWHVKAANNIEAINIEKTLKYLISLEKI